MHSQMRVGASLIQPPKSANHHVDSDELEYSVLVCLLGPFRLLALPARSLSLGGKKAEMLLSFLALHHRRGVQRDELLGHLWPEAEPKLASQSLNSLVFSLRKLFADHLRGAPPIVNAGGAYRLNGAAGVGVDVACFDRLADEGERHGHAGQLDAAAACYHRAAELYHGDLSIPMDPASVIERERLHARYLTLMVRLADYHYAEGNYRLSLDYALRLLARDPYREDAHRQIMRCYVRLGERAQAFRQYRLCQQLLRAEFDARPEPPTVALFDQIRLDPGSI